MVQTDSLELDLAATLESCGALYENLHEIIERETIFVRDQQIRLIVGDVPPLCFEIAARANIPSVAIGNFSWSWIYRLYSPEYPGFLPLADQMKNFCTKATVALTLPYSCNMDDFPRKEPIPWIARTSALTKKEARARFQLSDSAIIVLLSFGGLGLNRLPWDKLEQLHDFLFITTGESKKQQGKVLVLPETQRQYEDLVRAVDLIVTKPGYGIVADAIAHQLPILYTDRGEFPEYSFLVQARNDLTTAEFIPQTELLSGNIQTYLRRLVEKNPNWPRVSCDGARIAADKILALLDFCP
jgi:L-arabinokinase